MKIYDISQELLSSKVYEGDPSPVLEKLKDYNAEGYLLSGIKMSLHNGTHIDAPSHFNRFGESIDALPLEFFAGQCVVIEINGFVTSEIISSLPKGTERLLIKGKNVFTPAAAIELEYTQIRLVGIENQSIGGKDFMHVHKLLSGKKVAVIEGLKLKDVPVGTYFLCALPLNIKGAEASPCRAILIEGK